MEFTKCMSNSCTRKQAITWLSLCLLLMSAVSLSCFWLALSFYLYMMPVLLHLNLSAILHLIPDIDWCCIAQASKEGDWGAAIKIAGLCKQSRLFVILKWFHWYVDQPMFFKPLKASHSEHPDEEILNLRNTLLKVCDDYFIVALAILWVSKV